MKKNEIHFWGRLILLTIIASISCFAGIAFVPYSLMRMPTAHSDNEGNSPAQVTEAHFASASLSPARMPEAHFASVPSSCSGTPIGAGSASAILRLLQPSIKVSLCPTDVYEDPAQTQRVVDLEDTAAIFQLFGGDGSIDIIADHEGQAFAKLSEAKPGAVAEILNSSALPEFNPMRISGQGRLKNVHEFAAKEYCCTYCCEGVNSGTTIFLDDGTDIVTLPAGTLVLYTCHGDWEHVTVTVWREADGL